MENELLIENTNENFFIYQEVVEQIISYIEEGVAPWRLNFNTYGRPRNYLSGNHYKGINLILLNMAKRKIPYYLTIKQINEMGGSVRKGSKAHKVIYYNNWYEDIKGNLVLEDEISKLISEGLKVKVKRSIKYYNIFNIEDVNGIPFQYNEIVLTENEKIEKCEELLSKMKNMPSLGFSVPDRAFYNPLKDHINIPEIDFFQSSQEYYCTLFHELVHSTGHSSRLDRPEVMNMTYFGSDSYSKEELLAEVGTSMLCVEAQINFDEVIKSSASYLKGWIEVLREDSKFLFKVASKAEKVVKYIIN